MMTQFTSKWKEDDLQTLRTMRGDGASMGQIADVLGCTRNAIAGLVNRLGLALPKKRAVRPRTEAPPRARPNMMTINARAARRDPFKAPRPPIAPENRAERPADMPECRTTFEELSPGGCRWPEGDATPYLFCDAPVLKDRSYCACHCKLAFAPTPGLIRQREQYEVAA